MTVNPFRIAVTICVLILLVAGGWVLVFPPNPVHRFSADFASADGIFAGSRVAVLGVHIGTVESVQPQGESVRVTMTVPRDAELPAGANAYIMSPAVISDRFVELGPAYRGGEQLPDGARIPVERTHAPIKWDELSRSLDTLLRAIGPDGVGAGGENGLGELVHNAAGMLSGNGPKIRSALANVSQASDLLATGVADVGPVLDNLDALTQVLAKHKSTVDSLTQNVSQAAAQFSEQQGAIADTISQLGQALGGINDLVRKHGSALTGDLSQLTTLSTTLAGHQRDLAETLDTLPLALDNFGRAVSPEGRLRIRLDVSTNLHEFPPTAAICERLPLPLCSGAGLVNPIPIPPNLPDALGLTSAMNGGGG